MKYTLMAIAVLLLLWSAAQAQEPPVPATPTAFPDNWPSGTNVGMSDDGTVVALRWTADGVSVCKAFGISRVDRIPGILLRLQAALFAPGVGWVELARASWDEVFGNEPVVAGSVEDFLCRRMHAGYVQVP